MLTYSVIRFRRRPGDEGREPPQVYGSNQIELAWTVVPVLIVVILFLATARYIFGIERLQPPQRTPGHHRRAPMVVGDSLPRPGDHHGQ